MKDGSFTNAKPGFMLLRELLETYTLEYAAEVCAIPVETIRRIATECATIKPMSIIYGGSAFQ